jgi:hypothetical protein
MWTELAIAGIWIALSFILMAFNLFVLVPVYKTIRVWWPRHDSTSRFFRLSFLTPLWILDKVILLGAVGCFPYGVSLALITVIGGA